MMETKTPGLDGRVASGHKGVGRIEALCRNRLRQKSAMRRRSLNPAHGSVSESQRAWPLVLANGRVTDLLFAAFFQQRYVQKCRAIGEECLKELEEAEKAKTEMQGNGKQRSPATFNATVQVSQNNDFGNNF